MKDRIRKIMEAQGMQPASFADFLDINRQTMTATLSRNKTASISIVMPILEKIPDINPDWLLFGKEPMYKNEKTILVSSPHSSSQPSLFENIDVNTPDIPKQVKYAQDLALKTPQKEEKSAINQIDIPIEKEDKKIDKIVIFFSDKTFTTLIPEE